MRPHPKTLVHVLSGACALALLLLAAGGCRDESRPLRLGDLSLAERLYVERFVVLERARAVALVDAAAGDAVLDSLAAAWGDSALSEARAALPDDAERQAALHDLVAGILDAEEDSLVLAPYARRLAAPVVDPPPQEAPAETPTD